MTPWQQVLSFGTAHKCLGHWLRIRAAAEYPSAVILMATGLRSSLRPSLSPVTLNAIFPVVGVGVDVCLL